MFIAKMVVNWDALEKESPTKRTEKIIIHFVDLKSNSAILYNKGLNFWKVFRPGKIPQNWIFPF